MAADGRVSPLLPNNMRRDIRSPRQAVFFEAPRASSVYAELTVDSEFWAAVMRRYNTAIIEQRQPSALLRANMASHQALNETPEAVVLRQHADPSGSFVPLSRMAAALTALGADCSDRVAATITAQCAGTGSQGLTDAQFLMLAEGIRTAASQCVMAERLRCRTPDRDAALHLSLNRLGSPAEEGNAPNDSSVIGTPRGRSPSIGRVSSAAYRRPSPSARTASVTSARSGAHTLKSLASLHAQQRKAATEENSSMQTPDRRDLSRSSVKQSPFASPGTPRRSIAGASDTSAQRRSIIPEPTLDGHKDLGPAARMRKTVQSRNAVGTKQPVLQLNRFDIASFRW